MLHCGFKCIMSLLVMRLSAWALKLLLAGMNSNLVLVEKFGGGSIDLPLALLSGCFSWAIATDRNQDIGGKRK